MRTVPKTLIPAVLLLVLACDKEPAGPLSTKPDDVRDILLPVLQVPLYGDLSDYNLIPGTRGMRTDGPSVTLASLLDFDNARSLCFEGIDFSETPFLQNRDGILAGYGDEPDPDAGSATFVRKFFVETEQEGIRHRFVATMVAETQYARSHPGFDYLDMPDYTGAVLLSTPEGKVFRTETYRGGLVREAVILRPGEIPPDAEGLHYVKLYRQETRSPDGTAGELDGAICIAEKDSPDHMLLTTHPQYTVRITTNLPDFMEVQGCGTYSAGSWTTVGCLPKYALLSLEFGRWTGAFAGERRSLFPSKVARDLSSTAYYEDNGPCVDLVRGVANPLKQMAVAATASGNYVNGTYKALRGYYEDGTPRYHWGIDLYAKEGTKVYSMYSGTIVRIERDHPDRYEEGSFGNVIVTENDVKGCDRKVYLQYSHLQFGSPVAVNPRTGKPFEKGDAVWAGDLIGYTGRTGNAYDNADVPNKHLDLMAAFDVDPSTGRIRSGILTDPAPFLNGTLDLENLQRKKGKIEQIRCD